MIEVSYLKIPDGSSPVKIPMCHGERVPVVLRCTMALTSAWRDSVSVVLGGLIERGKWWGELEYNDSEACIAKCSVGCLEHWPQIAS